MTVQISGQNCESYFLTLELQSLVKRRAKVNDLILIWMCNRKMVKKVHLLFYTVFFTFRLWDAQKWLQHNVEGLLYLRSESSWSK